MEAAELRGAELGGPATKTLESQQTKGQQSYYYWHSAVPQGELAAPKPTPHQLSAEIQVKEQPPAAIESYAFLDDGECVKVYIPLEGPLAGLTAEGVTAEYQERSMRLVVRPAGSDRDHVLSVSELANPVRPDHCRAKITKSRKLVITLDKANSHHRWSGLRR